MAEQKTAPKAPKRFFIINPKGAIHEVSREHARERLRVAGWRLATADEIAALDAAHGMQVHDAPVAPRWSPDAMLDALDNE